MNIRHSRHWFLNALGLRPWRATVLYWFMISQQVWKQLWNTRLQLKLGAIFFLNSSWTDDVTWHQIPLVQTKTCRLFLCVVLCCDVVCSVVLLCCVVFHPQNMGYDRTHTCHNFNDTLAKPHLKLRRAWVITYHRTQYIESHIPAQITHKKY